jgi:hypothetical protein
MRSGIGSKGSRGCAGSRGLRGRERIGASVSRKSGWDFWRGGFVMARVQQQLLKIV